MSKLSAPQMRALRILHTYDVYTPADLKKQAAIALSTAYVLQEAGYAEVERFGRGYGEWKASITKAGEAKLDPPPIKPNVSLVMFLITGPDQYAANAENGAQVLTMLAGLLSSEAEHARRSRDTVLARQLEAAAEKTLGADPEYARWPQKMRFMTSGFQFLDFIAQRCEKRDET